MTERASTIIRVCLAGATGKMGREVIKSALEWQGIELASVVAKNKAGKNLTEVLGSHVPSLILSDNLDEELKSKKIDVLLDLTRPEAALPHALCAIRNGVAPVIGTSGLTADDLHKVENASSHSQVPAMVVPNFSVGAVLGMKFAQAAAQWLSNVEIIETHHEQKLDAPSGTALETARLIQESRSSPSPVPVTKVLKVEGVRGGRYCGVPIHSIRMNGVVAQQSVIFGDLGETLEIRHVVIDRSTYMRGIELSIRKVWSLTGLTIGLEPILK